MNICNWRRKQQMHTKGKGSLKFKRGPSWSVGLFKIQPHFLEEGTNKIFWFLSWPFIIYYYYILKVKNYSSKFSTVFWFLLLNLREREEKKIKPNKKPSQICFRKVCPFIVCLALLHTCIYSDKKWDFRNEKKLRVCLRHLHVDRVVFIHSVFAELLPRARSILGCGNLAVSSMQAQSSWSSCSGGGRCVVS